MSYKRRGGRVPVPLRVPPRIVQVCPHPSNLTEKRLALCFVAKYQHCICRCVSRRLTGRIAVISWAKFWSDADHFFARKKPFRNQTLRPLSKSLQDLPLPRLTGSGRMSKWGEEWEHRLRRLYLRPQSLSSSSAGELGKLAGIVKQKEGATRT